MNFSGWAHVVCALYIPEVRFGNVTTMEPIKMSSVPHERFLKVNKLAVGYQNVLSIVLWLSVLALRAGFVVGSTVINTFHKILVFSKLLHYLLTIRLVIFVKRLVEIAEQQMELACLAISLDVN